MASSVKPKLASAFELSHLAWESLATTKMLFLEADSMQAQSPPSPPATRLNLLDHLPETSKYVRVFQILETLGEFKTPVKRHCCRKPNQEGKRFSCCVFDAEGKEVMQMSKTTPAEVLLSMGSQNMGVIIQEDGLGKNEVPFRYTIHDAVGPVLVGYRSDWNPVTSWNIMTYGPESRAVAQISNKWFGLDDRHLAEQGFGLELERQVEPEFKGYLVAFLLTIVFTLMSTPPPTTQEMNQRITNSQSLPTLHY